MLDFLYPRGASGSAAVDAESAEQDQDQDENEDEADDEDDGDDRKGEGGAQSSTVNPVAGDSAPAAVSSAAATPAAAAPAGRGRGGGGGKRARGNQILERVDEFMTEHVAPTERAHVLQWSAPVALCDEIYGSLAVGLGSTASDLDIALLTPDARAQSWAHLRARDVLKQVVKAFRKNRNFGVNPILKTRTPIVTLTHRPTGITIDLSIADAHNPHKTAVMRGCYDREPCALAGYCRADRGVGPHGRQSAGAFQSARKEDRGEV
jgi:hypothetical protein